MGMAVLVIGILASFFTGTALLVAGLVGRYRKGLLYGAMVLGLVMFLTVQLFNMLPK